MINRDLAYLVPTVTTIFCGGGLAEQLLASRASRAKFRPRFLSLARSQRSFRHSHLTHGGFKTPNIPNSSMVRVAKGDKGGMKFEIRRMSDLETMISKIPKMMGHDGT